MYLTRSKAKVLTSEFPIGDPFGGPAYGQREDLGSVFGGVMGLLGSDNQADAASDAAASSSAAAKYSADLQKQMYDQTRADQTPWRDAGGNALDMLSQYMGMPSQYADYYGMSDEQLRNALLSQYTTQGTQTQSNYPNLSIPQFQNIRSRRQNNTQNNTQPGIDEKGLAAEMERIKAGLSGYDPNAENYGSLMQKFSMKDFNADPGYQFRMDQGLDSLEGRAAAGGGLKSGNTLKALMEYGQNLGSQEYGNAYNRYNTDQNTQYNRLSNMAGLGQTANSALQSAGTNYANSVGNLMTNNAANQGNALLAGANARSSSYGAIGNALGNYFGGQSNPAPSYTSGGNTYTGDFVYDNGNLVPMNW